MTEHRRLLAASRNAILIAVAVVALSIGLGVIAWRAWSDYRPALVALALLSLAIHAGAAFVAWLIVYLLSWRVLPAGFTQPYHTRRVRYGLIILSALAFLGVTLLVVNKLWLPGRLHPGSLVADVLILIVSIALGIALLSGRRGAWSGFGVGVVVLAVATVLIHVAVPVEQAAPATRASIKSLQTLPYLTWVPTEDGEKSGVTYNDSTRAAPGLNVYCSANRAVTLMFENDGRVVHHWAAEDEDKAVFWFTEVTPEGDLIALYSSARTPGQLMRLDWESNIEWTLDGLFHHDVCVDTTGDIYSVRAAHEVVDFHGFPLPLVNEYISVVSAEGRLLREYSIYDVVVGRLPRRLAADVYLWLIRQRGWHLLADLFRSRDPRWSGARQTPLSPFHANNIELADHDVPGLFPAGSFIVCVRNMDLVLVTDPEMERVFFDWGPGKLQRPHNPSLLDNGNILVYDNGPLRGYTRVLEIDPRSGEIVWQYTGEPETSFYSHTKGSCQRLRNGNTLITNSNSGQVFEVDPDGVYVWEYVNPETMDGSRATIYRLARLEDPVRYPFMSRLMQ